MHGWYAAAHVAGTKGLEGKLRLINASAFLRSGDVGNEVAFVPPLEDAPRFARIEAVEETGNDGCLVAFSDVTSMDMAQALVGCTLLLEGDAPEGIEDGEGLRWLHGYALEDAALGEVGVIEYVDDDPSRFQPLLHVKRADEAGSALIPFVEELIVDIDDAHRKIVMDLPAGILDL